MIYDFVVKQKGSDVSLGEFKGKVLLIVNTATRCGFTPQYTGLEALYEKYNSKGFEILDFPCNQFLFQAPGSDEEINEDGLIRFVSSAEYKYNPDEENVDTLSEELNNLDIAW